MVYIKSWQQFQKEAETVYAKSPKKARYCVKWRHVEGSLVLKVTDDVTCVKYKTRSNMYFHRFLALNLSLMEKMQNRKLPQVSLEQPSDGGPRASTPQATGSTPQPSGGKKRPAKKKK